MLVACVGSASNFKLLQLYYTDIACSEYIWTNNMEIWTGDQKVRHVNVHQFFIHFYLS